MGGNKDQKYILLSQISPGGSKKRQKESLDSSGTFDLKSVYHVINGMEGYKELGADYVTQRVEKRRKLYLKKELEKLGYAVQLIQPVP